MNNLFQEILNMSIISSLLIAVVIVFRALFKKVPRKIICVLWALVALRLICPLSVESKFSLIPNAKPIETVSFDNKSEIDIIAADNSTIFNKLPEYSDDATDYKEDIVTSITNNRYDFDTAADGLGIAENNYNLQAGDKPSTDNFGENNLIQDNKIQQNLMQENPAQENQIQQNQIQENSIQENLISKKKAQDIFGGMVIRLIWLAGAAIILGYGIFSYLLLRRKVMASVNMEENIYLCDYIDTPFILGVFSPKIYIPSILKEERIYVIAHEKAHISRLDHFWKPLGYIILAVHWFNPLVWVSYILLCKDIEIACDEKVISRKSLEYKKSYAKTLLSCSSKGKIVTACPLAFGEVSVKERIRTILNYKKPAFWIIVSSVIACIVLGLCFLTNPVTPEPVISDSGMSDQEDTKTQIEPMEKDSQEDNSLSDSSMESAANSGTNSGVNIENNNDNGDADSSKAQGADIKNEYTVTVQGISSRGSTYFESSKPITYKKEVTYNNWRITADEKEGYEYSYYDRKFNIYDPATGINYGLFAYDLDSKSLTYDELKTGELNKWLIKDIDGILEEYIDGEVSMSIYRYYEDMSEGSGEKAEEGYLVIYGTSESKTVWYMFMPYGMPRVDVDAVLADIHVERYQEKYASYNPRLDFSCMEQYENAVDRIEFLLQFTEVSDEARPYIKSYESTFVIFAKEAEETAPETYEKLKNPVTSAAELLDIDYESYEMYHGTLLNRVYVMFTLKDGSNQIVEMDYRDEVDLWQPLPLITDKREAYTNIILINEYIDAANADRLRQITREVDADDELMFCTADEYVLLSTVEDKDIALYGLYGGRAMVLRVGNKVLPIWTSWYSQQMILPKIYCGDYDNDGMEEYALWTHMNTGTEGSEDGLYIIETDWEMNSEGDYVYSIEQYVYEDWLSELDKVQYQYNNDNSVTFSIDGKAMARLDLSELIEENKRKFGGIKFGNDNSFYEEDGKWHFSAISGVYLFGIHEPKMECRVIVNADVKYDEIYGFSLENMKVSTESVYD